MRRFASIYLLSIVIVLILPLSLAMPSAFEKDNSGKDLNELEDMLSGEHRGSAYSGSNVVSSPPLVQQLDNPNTGFFKNDTFFGDFVRAFYGDSATDNQSWAETFLNGTSLLAANTTAEMNVWAGPHLIKPVLITGPRF